MLLLTEFLYSIAFSTPQKGHPLATWDTPHDLLEAMSEWADDFNPFKAAVLDKTVVNIQLPQNVSTWSLILCGSFVWIFFQLGFVK